MNASAGVLTSPDTRINHKPLTPQFADAWRDAIDLPMQVFLKLTVRGIREEPEGVEDLLLLGAKILGGECVCVEAGVLDHYRKKVLFVRLMETY